MVIESCNVREVTGHSGKLFNPPLPSPAPLSWLQSLEHPLPPGSSYPSSHSPTCLHHALLAWWPTSKQSGACLTTHDPHITALGLLGLPSLSNVVTWCLALWLHHSPMEIPVPITMFNWRLPVLISASNHYLTKYFNMYF